MRRNLYGVCTKDWRVLENVDNACVYLRARFSLEGGGPEGPHREVESSIISAFRYTRKVTSYFCGDLPLESPLVCVFFFFLLVRTSSCSNVCVCCGGGRERGEREHS